MAQKRSYTLPCPTSFRDQVLSVAARRGVNIGDLARSVVLVFGPEQLAGVADPGEPEGSDRETVIVKSGRAKGRPWQRKPRLQVRLQPGFDAPALRRALAVAVDLDRGRLEGILQPDSPSEIDSGPETDQQNKRISDLEGELIRLRQAIELLSFEPFVGGVSSRAEALHVMGFPPDYGPDRRELRTRFRLLATVHHPDARSGDHRRMSQLNEAMDLLAGFVA